jgi:hypothetical protein
VEIIGLIITAFLLFLGFRGVITGLSQRWRLRKMKQALAEPRLAPIPDPALRLRARGLLLLKG